ncbi:MAG: hypothetical protein RLZZ387_4240 [Chloroflexota bacterium]
MRYVLRDGLFGPGDPYEIPNEHGWRALVAAPGQPWRESLMIRDRAGIERATLTLRRYPSGAAYELMRRGRPLALVTREAGLLSSTVVLCLEEEGGEARVCGDLAASEYRIAMGDAVLAEVSRRWHTREGLYGVEVADGQRDALLLAACVAVDALARRAAKAGLRGWLRRAA